MKGFIVVLHLLVLDKPVEFWPFYTMTLEACEVTRQATELTYAYGKYSKIRLLGAECRAGDVPRPHR